MRWHTRSMTLRHSPARRWAIAAALVLVTLAVFWPVLGHGFVNYDDDVYVTANPHVREGLSPGSLRWAWTTGQTAKWHPLTWI